MDPHFAVRMFPAVLALLACLPAYAQPLAQGWQKLESNSGSFAADPGLPAASEWKDVQAEDVRGGQVHLLRIPLNVKNLKDPALYFPKSVFSFRVFADGRLIYQHQDESQFLPGRFTGWLWHLVPLPPIQNSEIVLQVYSAMPLRMVVPVLGEREAHLRSIVSSSLNSFAVVVISAALGFIFLFLFLRGPGIFYGSLAAFYFCMSWWLFNVNQISAFVLPSMPWRLQSEYFALYLAPVAACLFVDQAVPSRLSILVRVYAGILGMYAVGALFLDVAGIFAMYRTLLPFDLLALGGTILFLALVVIGVAAGRFEARILGAGIAAMALFVIHDVLVVFGVVTWGLKMHWGTLAFVLSMTGVAVYRVGRMHLEIREMKDHLQELVQERTQDLNTTLKALQKKDDVMQQELEIACGIQSQMLLSLPVSSGRLQIHGFYRAMHEVSGDFYDLAPTRQGATAFLMADVSGHGVPAALIMAMVKAIFHESALLSESPGLILAHLNNRLARNLSGSGHYVTASVLVADESGGAEFSNGAHRPAVYLPSGDHADSAWLDTNGTILGAFSAGDNDYAVRRLRLSPGDRILFYTDGIVELRGPGRDHFGQMRLLRFFLRTRNKPPDIVSEELQRELEKHAFGSPAEDDMTFVCLTWT